MLGLRKINKDGKHYDFTWPLEVGSKAIAPDWNPEAVCGGGLHVFPEGIGNLSLLDGYYWVVVEYDETKSVDLDGKIKVPECTIVHISENPDGLLEYFPKMKNPTSEQAYFWARKIGDVEYMRQFVSDSQWAYCWARDIGDREHMRQFVTKSPWAVGWARYLGDREYMRQFVTDSEWAYYWARFIGDETHMLEIARGSKYEPLIKELINARSA